MAQLIIKVIDGDTKQPLEASISLTGVKEGNFVTDAS